MSRIKSKNTKTELIFRKALWAKNIRFRIHTGNLIGKPDIFIARYRLIIFIDGDFWHGYNWQVNKNRIKTNADFWVAKIESNIHRDVQVNRQLYEKGFTVMRFWEHEILNSLDKCVNQVLLYIESGNIPDKDTESL